MVNGTQAVKTLTKRQNIGEVEIKCICRQKINVNLKLKFILDNVEKIVKKCYQYFLLFP